jgi:uncharacterized linocin/CFP29 family protein
MMDHLHRELAPLSGAAWDVLEDEARTRLSAQLAARRVVDFAGPHGWSHSATDLGRIATIPGPSEGVTAAQRRVLPLVELRAEFGVSRVEIDDVDRGASNPDLAQLDEAARQIAVAENFSVFHGYEEAGILGITESTSHQPIELGPDEGQYPTVVARATDAIRGSGIDGPYGLVLSPEIYTGIVETAEHGGHLLFDHLRQILGGPLVWAPGVEGGIVLSLRGGDFLFESGQDLSVGYLDHDADVVRLYIEESFNFRVLEPDAAVALHLEA